MPTNIYAIWENRKAAMGVHQIQRMGLLGITVVLLLGFWVGLWYQGQRRDDTLILAEESGETSGEEGRDSRTRITNKADGDVSEPDNRRIGGSEGREDETVRLEGEDREEAEELSDEEEIDTLSNREWFAAQYSRSGALAVHVVGNVASPGVYFMPQGSRIYDAVMEAEPEEDADLSKINMALPVEDGMQIRVPIIGRPSPWDGDALILRASDQQENIDTGTDTSGVTGDGKVNINKAAAKELETLPGIGPAYSQRIIQYREHNGGFKSIEELQKVNGIGPAKMSALRDLVCV